MATVTTRTTPTTTLIISKPNSFDQLKTQYKLIRYELPPNLRWKAKNNRNAYGQMHNSLRDQLDCPYKTFKFDRLDKETVKWVVYALYPLQAPPTDITISSLSNGPLPWREISFDQLDLHLLLKLLQIAYFRGEQASRFIGQDLCYVYAKHIRQGEGRKKEQGEHDYHICLQIDLKGDIRNQTGDTEQEFKVIGQARPFQRVNHPTEKPPYAYFGRHISKGNKVYFLHLKKSEIQAHIESNHPVYAIQTHKGKRTTLLYHDLQHIEESVGKLLYDFIRDFTAYLKQYGITSCPKERHFTELRPPKDQSKLNLSLLSPIVVYDNRLNRFHPLREYIELFQSLEPDLQFIEAKDLSEPFNGAVLILQDYNKKDFEHDEQNTGILVEHADPYIALYSKYPHLPKQSLVVNPNTYAADTTPEEYLNYSLPEKGSKDFKIKLGAALNQLYLKNVVYCKSNVQQRLPLAPTDYIFIRKDRYIPGQPPFETLLFFQDDTIHFLDLRDPIQKDQRDELLSDFGVDWETMYDQMLLKYRKTDEYDDSQDLTHYDVIIGKNLFIELEDLNERVLYDYDEIIRRQNAVEMELPVEDFKLLPYYDEICKASHLSLSQLLTSGLLQGEKRPRNEDEADSVKFYRQLEEYDAFLDELQSSYPTISYEELTRGDLWEQIIRIFGIQPDKHGQYNRRLFKGYYQKRNWFSSDKAKDVHMYEGIWYDQNNCYMVGSSQPMNKHQPRAHLIRRFDVYQGTGSFDIKPLLLATSVQFVRQNQYTVYPYAFHLIDIYVENVLRFR